MNDLFIFFFLECLDDRSIDNQSNDRQSFVLLNSLLLIIYARIKDRKDLEKLGVTSLVDNHKCDEYFYEILVFTGHRKDAGTKSNVYFILAGDDNETSVRRLADPHGKVLQQGGIDAFIMAIPK